MRPISTPPPRPGRSRPGRLRTATRTLRIGVAGGLLVVATTMAAPLVVPAEQERPRAQPRHAAPTAAPRPLIVSRARWGADEKLRDEPPHYSRAVHAVIIHHTDNPNDYDCGDVPAMLRAMYVGHARGRGWGDLGYNFLVDRCGNVYEGRAGGADRPVDGAHTVGLNKETTGVAAIGTFYKGTPVPRPMIASMARLIGWKLQIADVDPRSRTRLKSTDDRSRFPKGKVVDFAVVAGHIDAYSTNCPGEALMRQLPRIRQEAARFQGRTGDVRARPGSAQRMAAP